ncbi:MAG TPA: type II toxin-antitoxin system RelB/DinJ family antitoxin [Methylocystis sp.]|nr:type II toxin-antitoxin system RelB/DinJ family antitoxin [Methylocystis sp.]
MPSRTSMLHIRVDDETKQRATAALGAMGLSMSEAVRLFLHRVVAEKAFPLELKVPNAETRAAMAEADEILKARRVRFANAEKLFAALEKDCGR